jgi:hypothetical protein
MRLRCVFVLAFVFSIFTAPLAAQSALGQLESMTGQKVQRFKSSSSMYGPDALTPSQQLTVGIISGLLGSLLNPTSQPNHGPDPAAAAQAEAMRQEAEKSEQRALQAWAANYSNHMNQLQDEQRQLRASENKSSDEALSSALSDVWDGGAHASQPGGLADALSDPNVVDLRGVEDPTPSLLRSEDGAPRSAKVTADQVLKRHEEAQARLKAMMQEDRDPKQLGQRFYELENQLSCLRSEAISIGTKSQSLSHDFDTWGWQVDEAVQNSLERGTSLLTDIIIPEGTDKGFETLKKDPKTWNDTLEAFSQINDFTGFITEMGDRYDAGREAVDWVQAKRNLFKDLDFVYSHLGTVSKTLGPLSEQWELGKNIVGSGLDVAQELDAWGDINNAQGDLKLLKVRQQILQNRMQDLVGQLQASRTTLAVQLGVRPEDLIPTTRPNDAGCLAR